MSVILTNRLVVLRAEKGWSQQVLANHVNVSRQTIMHIEKNKYSPSLVLAFKIANALDTQITEIFDYSEGEIK